MLRSLPGDLPAHTPITALAHDPNNTRVMIAAAYDANGIYRSDDAGETWRADNQDLARAPVFVLLALERELFAGTAAGLYRRAWNADYWQRADPVPPVAVYGLARDDAGAVYAATDGRGIWKSDDANVWARLAGLDDEPLLSVLALGDTILAGTGGRGMFVSRDGGKTWQPDATFQNDYVSMLRRDPRDGSTIFARGRNGLYRSREGGAAWQELAGGIETEIVNALEFADDTILAATSGGKIFVSDTNGETWRETSVENPRRRAVLSLFRIEKTLYAGSFDGLLRSVDNGASWQLIGQGLGAPIIYDLALDAARSRILVALEDGLYEIREESPASSPSTASVRIEMGVSDVPVTAVAIAPNAPQRIYAGTDGRGVFVSDDGARTWNPATGELGGRARIAQLAVDPANPEIVFARVLFERIYKSMDGGDSWRTVWTGMPVEEQIQTLAIAPNDPQQLYAGGDTQFFGSEDGGETWQARGLTGVSTLALWIDPNQAEYVWAGATDGLYVSADGGNTWRGPLLQGKTISALTRDARGNMYVGTKYNGVWRTAGEQTGFTQMFSQSTNDPAPERASIKAIVFDERRGRMLVATGEGLYSLVVEGN